MESNVEEKKSGNILEFLKGKVGNKKQQNAVDSDIEYETPIAERADEVNVTKHEVTMPTAGIEDYKFDPTKLSPLTRYDFIELPSKGECYKHKKNTIPVRELTASDENLIASPNMYMNGQLIDTLLRRCILDKEFNVDEMCPGDRDAVVLWLRATAFGSAYNVKTQKPGSDKVYTVEIDLSKLEYKPFELKADENGYFDYTFDNGDVAKFKILSYKETQDLQNEIALQYVNQKKFDIYKKANEIRVSVDEIFKQELEDEPLNDAIDYILEWASKDTEDVEEDVLYSNFVTQNLINRTISINGDKDRKHIEEYINSLRLKESKSYREYLFNHLPGIDFSIEVPVPESDGGGSFNSFLRYDDTIFFE